VDNKASMKQNKNGVYYDLGKYQNEKKRQWIFDDGILLRNKV
jgi:hypothetical protein